MSPPESSELGRQPPHLSSTTIPDLTAKIIRPDDQYSEAGGFGDVFRCLYTSDDGIQEVAVKAFRFSFTIDEHKRDGENLKGARMIRRELGIWRRLSHRNVVPFLGIVYGFGRQGSASLVSMWMPHGTLHMFLEMHNNRLAVAHRLQLLLDIANGLQYLHSFPLVHGDLSSNNVLLDHNYNACLTDFGCASLVGELPEGFTYLKMSTVGPGTLRWAAPEHFSLDEGETKHAVKSDIYSFGNMALLVLSGKYPWSEVRVDAAVVLRLSQGYKPGRPLARPIDDRHWAFIERCWSSVPERPLAEDAVSSLQQLLDAYPPPPPLRDLLDALTPSSSVPDFSSNDDATPIASPLLSLTPTGMSSFVPYSVPEDIPRRPDPSTSSPERAEGESSYSNLSAPSTRPKRGPGAEDTVSRKKPTTGKRTPHSPSDGQLPSSKWARGTVLGTGTYGRVYLSLNPSTGEMVAVKQVKKDNKNGQGPNFVAELKIEQETLSGLDHPHIIAYLGSEETSTFLNIILEYVHGGSIGSFLQEHGRFDEDVVKSFTGQMFDGLAYLHAHHVIHRNVEPNNVLVDSSGVCKISGFGNAQRAGDDRASWIPMRGTVPWTAPEMITGHGGKRYGYKVDVWSGGCVLLKMWAGGKPGDGYLFSSMVEAARKEDRSLPLPLGVISSDLAIDFRNRCFAIDPEERASAAELTEHFYLTLGPDWVFTGFAT